MRKKVEDPYVKRITVRFKENEYEKLLIFCKRSTCVKLSDYARKRLLEKPIVYTTRNQSVDDLLAELLLVKKYLSSVASNINQAVKKMHSAKLPEHLQAAFISLRFEQASLQEQMKNLESFMVKIKEHGSTDQIPEKD